MQGVLKRLNLGDINQRITNALSLPQLPFFFIGFGIVVRLSQYFSGRSLWADEATLSLNILNRSYQQLWEPLDYQQGAPIGFLMLEKFATETLGHHDYALRFFPLIFGILALFLFLRFAKQFLSPAGVTIAVALFASLPYLVYFSAEVKQYSGDVAIALLLFLVLHAFHQQELTVRRIVIEAFVGAIAIWFSHPAVFVLAGVEAGNFGSDLLQKKPISKAKILSKIPIYLTWIVSFAVFYWIAIRSISGNEDLYNSWWYAFPESLFDINWLYEAFTRFFLNPLGFFDPIDKLAMLACCVGVISYFISQKSRLILLLAPLFVTLLATYLGKYPFDNRLVIFLTPAFIVLIAEGIEFLRTKMNLRWMPWVGNSVLALVMFAPIFHAIHLIAKPVMREEIKPVLQYVQQHRQPGDVVYVYQRGKYQFRYYAEMFGFREGDYLIGVNDLDEQDGRRLSKEERQRYRTDLNQFIGAERFWIIFSHSNIQEENQWLKAHLDHIGTQTDAFYAEGAFVYRYDLRKNR